MPLAAGHGPISDMAVSPDGRCLVTAHYGADVVSRHRHCHPVGHRHRHRCREPYAAAIADRAYVTAASTEDDSVVAIDTLTGIAFAAKDIRRLRAASR